jgi:hypothetical protein
MPNRKTIDVKTVTERVNRALSMESKTNTPDYRRGLAAVLEDILDVTDNYRGFMYLPAKLDENGDPLPTDNTRRAYRLTNR